MRFAKRNKLHVCYGESEDWYERHKDKSNPCIIRGYGGRSRRDRPRRFDIRDNTPWASGRISYVYGRSNGIYPIGQVGPTHDELAGKCFGGGIRDDMWFLRWKLNSREFMEKHTKIYYRQASQNVGDR